LSSIIVGIITAMPTSPVYAQHLTYYSIAHSDQGASFKLIIHRSGNRLRFHMGGHGRRHEPIGYSRL
jgi:hypothetical protein